MDNILGIIKQMLAFAIIFHDKVTVFSVCLDSFQSLINYTRFHE